MGRTRLDRAVAELKRNIEKAKSDRKKLLEYVDNVKKKCLNKEITYYEYENLLNLKGRTTQELYDEYDYYLKNAESEIKKLERKSKTKKILNVFFICFLGLALIFSFFYLRPVLIGFIVHEQIQSYNQIFNSTFSESSSYEWKLENSGQLNSVKLSGAIEGDGDVEVYLDNLLIFKSSKIESQKIKKSETLTGNSIKITGKANEEINQETQASEPSAQQTVQETSNSESGQNTQSNSENKNAEEGSRKTSPSQENLLPASEPEKGNTENNEQKKEEPQAENIAEPSNTTELENPENITEEIKNETPAEIDAPVETEEITIREFSNICEETCSLKDLNLSHDSYTLKIKISNAKLSLNEIKYEIISSTIEIPFFPSPENITNIEISNITIPENIIIANASGANLTLNFTEITVQSKARIGSPVKWKKSVKLEKPSGVKIRLPKEAENIIVNKISYSQSNSEEVNEEGSRKTSPSQENPLLASENNSKSDEEIKALQEKVGKLEQELEEIKKIVLEKNNEEQESAGITSGITGHAIILKKSVFRIIETKEEKQKNSWIKNLFLRLTGAITGRAITTTETSESKEVLIEDTGTEYEINYETPSPYTIEEKTARGKKIEVIGIETIHYENILAYTNLTKEASREKIKLYRTTNGIRESAEIINYSDLNSNGLIEHIEWNVPFLSNQTYELEIIIINAEHLDSNRTFISDIYEQVKELDGNWSEEIKNNEFVRVTFNKNLTNENDITLYPRITSGNPRIEVYEINGNEKIAEFSSLNENQYNKIYLANLISESQDVFDLKVIGGSVEFEHIIDPGQALWFEDCTDITDWVILPSGEWASDPCTSSNGNLENMTKGPTDALGATSMNISFDWTDGKLDGGVDSLNLSISTNNITYTNVWSRTGGGSSTVTGSASVNITAFISSTVYVRFTCSSGGGENCKVDNINLSVIYPPDINYPIFSVFDSFPANASNYVFNQIYIFNSTILNTNNTVGLEFNKTNYTAFNLTANVYNVTILNLAAGTYSYYWWALGNGTQKNFNFSDIYYYVVNKSIPIGNLTNGTSWTVTYPTQTNISFQEPNAGDSDVRYNVSRDGVNKNGGENITLAVGTYVYVLNTTGGMNYTANSSMDTKTLTVNQGTGVVNGTINGTKGNFSAAFSSAQNIYINATNVTGYGTGKIYVNGSLYNQGAMPLFNVTNFSLGYYNVTFEYDGNQNFSGMNLTLWVNVTADPDTTPPSIYFLNPANYTLTSSSTWSFGANATDNINVTNMTLYIWNSTNILINQTTNITNVITAITNISVILPRADTYKWNYFVCDNAEAPNCVWNNTNWTIVYDNVAPSVYLIAPANNTRTNIATQYFNATFTNNNLKNATLYIWNSTNSLINNTENRTITGASDSTNISIILPRNDSYKWNYYVCDLASNCAWNNTNWTLTLDTIYPIFSTYRDDNGSLVGSGVGWFNVTVLNANGTVLLEINNTNITASNITANVYNATYNFSSNGTYSYKWISWGNGGNTNLNVSNTRSYTVNVSISNTAPDNPVLSLVSFDGTNSSGSNLNCSSRITDPDDGNLLNVSVQWYNNSVLAFEFDYNNSYANNTLFNATLGFNNLSYGENWTCGIRLSDGLDYSNWVNSSNLTVLNFVPRITEVFNSSINGSVLNEAPALTNFVVNFSVYDADGFGDLNDSKAMVNFTKTGEDKRENLSCYKFQSNGDYANYTCNVTMYWWDGAGVWTIITQILDNRSSSAINSSTTFSLGTTTGFVIGPSALTWETIAPGMSNQTASSYILLNNTGNVDINGTNVIQINSTNLKGEIDNSQALWANNFSAAPFTGALKQECNLSATIMNASVFVNISYSSLTAGNYTKNDGNTGQEQLYFCLRKTSTQLLSQAYSTSEEGLWTIKIVAFLSAVYVPGFRRRKKKLTNKINDKKSEIESFEKPQIQNSLRRTLKAISFGNNVYSKSSIENDKLMQAMNLILDELKEQYSLNKKEISEILLNKLKTKYNVSKKEISELIIEKQEINIPASIFSKKLGALESLVKFMKENLNMNYREISKMLNRNERTIWTSYKKSKEKNPESLEIKKSNILLPISIFKNRELTVLESIIVYLKSNGYRYREIGKLVNRDERNIWTVYSRAVKKLNSK